MKDHMKILLLLVSCIWFAEAKTQFKNASFNNGSTTSWPHTIYDWTNGNCQWVQNNYVTYEDPFIDLTGSGFGNGYYIAQSIYTVKGKKYKISFDLGTFFGWDLYDAGVTVSLDGVNLGTRIFHKEFTNSRDTFMRWKRLSTIEFSGTGSNINVRITGNSELVTSFGFNSGPGVIGLDNVTLDEVSTNTIETKVEPEVQIGPNPANNFIRVHGIENTTLLSYSITDFSGKEINRGKFENNQIDISGIKNGLYAIQLNFGPEKTIVKKILVQHE
jgi:hypothetical protein